MTEKNNQPDQPLYAIEGGVKDVPETTDSIEHPLGFLVRTEEEMQIPQTEAEWATAGLAARLEALGFDPSLARTRFAVTKKRAPTEDLHKNLLKMS